MQNVPMLCAIAVTLVLPVGLLGHPRSQSAAGEEPVKIIDVSAKKYEFTPNEIHVKKGTKVELRVHSVDTTHGIKLSLYPNEGRTKRTPGLIFTNPDDNGKVEKGKDQILDFVAQEAGTYEFKCSKRCGFGHHRMKGKLIVEE